MRFFREDPITLKLLVLFLDMNQEQETTICINNTEMYLLMVQSVNSTQKWLVITEPHQIQFPSSELQFLTRRARLEDPNQFNTEIVKSDFQFSEQLFVQVKKDTEIFSKQTDQIPSVNDLKYLNLIKSFIHLYFFTFYFISL